MNTVRYLIDLVKSTCQQHLMDLMAIGIASYYKICAFLNLYGYLSSTRSSSEEAQRIINAPYPVPGSTDMIDIVKIKAIDSTGSISANQQPELTNPGSNMPSDSSSSSDNEDDEYSNLAYILTLFDEKLEEDVGDNITESGRHKIEYPIASVNSITARILLRSNIDFERQKPIAQKLKDQQIIRSMIENFRSNYPFTKSTVDKEWFKYEDEFFAMNKSLKGVVAAICVEATLPSAHSPSIYHQLSLRLHRDADEPAERTLQRLSISLQRRYHQQERKLEKDQCWKDNLMQQKQAFYIQGNGCTSRKSLSSNRVEGSIWVKDHVSKVPCACDEWVRFPVEDITMNIVDLWQHLQLYEFSEVCIPLTTVKDTAPSHNSRPISESTLSVCLPIVACPPTVLSVQTFENFNAYVFVGVPLVVEVEVVHAERAIVAWFANRKEILAYDTDNYTPRPDDVGKSLSILVIPIRSGHDGQGCEEVFEFKRSVEDLPEMPLISPLRDVWVQDTTRVKNQKTNLRVMTYNILADLYAARDLDQHVMYNHCQTSFLQKERRMPMILHELLVFQPDILCLQEVDALIFTHLFCPCLERKGYQGFYSNKASSQLEGCAVFWSLECFHRASKDDMHELFFKEVFKDHSQKYACWESLGDIDRLFEENAELSRIAKEKVGQVLQVAELRLRNPTVEQPGRLIVGNTHLFYHPLASHIRAMQAYMVCRQMEMIRHRRGDFPCPLIFCGDFNASPLSGAIQLLLERQVGPENYHTWKHLHSYNWEMGDEEFLLEHGYIGNTADMDECPLYEDEDFEDALESFDTKEANSETEENENDEFPKLRLPPSFPKLNSGYRNIPEFTNYAVDFSETLDYILASEPSSVDPYGFIPIGAAPVPTHDFMKKYVAMPNENMPSDHVSLVCDLKWNHHGS